MTNYTARDIGRNIRLHRKKIGMTQQELAQKLNISRPTMIAIESGTGLVAVEKVLAAINILEVPILLGGDVKNIPTKINPNGLTNQQVEEHLFSRKPIPTSRGRK